MFQEDEPPKVDVVHNGWVLEIKTKLSKERLDLDQVYGARMRKQKEIALDSKLTEVQRKAALDKYASLKVPKIAEQNALEAIRDAKQENYSWGVFRQPLDAQCMLVDDLVIFGDVLCVDLVVKKTTKSFQEAKKVAAKGSPSK